MATFAVIALCGCLSGAVGVVVMSRLNAEYSHALTGYGFSQGDIGKLVACFCRVDGNVHDAVSYTDAGDKNAAAKNVQKQTDKMSGYFDAVQKTVVGDAEQRLFDQAKAAWEEYAARAPRAPLRRWPEEGIKHKEKRRQPVFAGWGVCLCAQ